MDVTELVDFILSTEQNVLIEAEAKASSIDTFILDYNAKYTPLISRNSTGIVILQDSANKWGLELRVYFTSKAGMPAGYVKMARVNDTYKNQYTYRINNNDVVNALFESGFRIGINTVS